MVTIYAYKLAPYVISEILDQLDVGHVLKTAFLAAQEVSAYPAVNRTSEYNLSWGPDVWRHWAIMRIQVATVKSAAITVIFV